MYKDIEKLLRVLKEHKKGKEDILFVSDRVKYCSFDEFVELINKSIHQPYCDKFLSKFALLGFIFVGKDFVVTYVEGGMLEDVSVNYISLHKPKEHMVWELIL